MFIQLSVQHCDHLDWKKKTVLFAGRLPTWSSTFIIFFCPKWLQAYNIFTDLSAIIYDCVYYRNLSNIVVKKFKQSG